MIKHNLVVVLTVSMLVISACGGGGATSAETAIVAPVDTATSAPPTATTNAATSTTAPATETPTSVAAAATATVVAPTNAPDCVNSAAFVTDVTIEDNSNIAAGSTFTKTWRVKNTGTCVWNSGYALEYYSEEAMGVTEAVPLEITYPDQTLDISVQMTAPTTLGTHRGNFVIKNPEGLIMKIDNDSRLWVIINVIAASNTSAATATSTPASTTSTPAATTTGGTPGAAVVPSGTVSAGTIGTIPAACALTTDETRVSGVIAAINAYRAQNGIVAYITDPRLTQAAQTHANDIACNKLFVHTGSDGSTPTSRVAATGYQAQTVSENVYGSYPPLSPQDAVSWWATDQTDPRHNQNLISTQYTQIGVGYAFFDNYGFYVVVFAQP